jgi:hypothetical protein
MGHRPSPRRSRSMKVSVDAHFFGEISNFLSKLLAVDGPERTWQTNGGEENFCMLEKCCVTSELMKSQGAMICRNSEKCSRTR